MKIIERIVNSETNEIVDLERNETPDEAKTREHFEKVTESNQQLEAENQAKKAALLTKLGISADEAKLLLS